MVVGLRLLTIINDSLSYSPARYENTWRCQPGTRLEDRLADFDPTTGLHSDFITPPINLLDYGCYKHDLAYSKHADTSRRNVADSKLYDVADFVLKNPESTRTQRVNAAAVKKIMKGKIDHNY